MMRWARQVTCTEEMRNAYKVLIGKLEGKGPVGRRSGRWEDTVNMDLEVIGTGVISESQNMKSL
jgi:hypothetical protein